MSEIGFTSALFRLERCSDDVIGDGLCMAPVHSSVPVYAEAVIVIVPEVEHPELIEIAEHVLGEGFGFNKLVSRVCHGHAWCMAADLGWELEEMLALTDKYDLETLTWLQPSPVGYSEL